jgi:TolA-binding protein
MKYIILAIAIICCDNSRADEKKIAYAHDLKVHNLNEKATEAFLSILHQTENPDTKALCLLNLGELALQSNKVDLARLDWEKIIENYPDTKESKLLKEK